MAICAQSNLLGMSLARQAARLQGVGGPEVAQALSAFVGDLPPLGPTGGGGTLSRGAVEAYAGLYYYGELEEASLMALAELIVEQRYELANRINDASLFEALEAMDDQMRRGWYDQARRATIFGHLLGFGGQNDIRGGLARVADALARFDQNRRYAPPSQSDGIAVEFAMGTLLSAIGTRAGLGLERAAQVLNGQLRTALAILGNAALHRAFRVNDMWGLLSEVAVTPQGGAPDVSAIVERAQAGAAVIGWMAARVPQISARNGSLHSQLLNDATLFRQAARWQMAARGANTAGGAPNTGGSQPAYPPGSGYGQGPGYGPPSGQAQPPGQGWQPNPSQGNPWGGWA